MPFIPHTEEEINEMLRAIGIASINDLFTPLPQQIDHPEISLPYPMSELEVSKHLHQLSNKNKPVNEYISFLGGGAYEHFIPAVVKSIISKGEFYTAYTPYQAEASQGFLQAFFEYQKMICELTGMDVSNASLYDGGTAVAEAAFVAIHHTKRKKIIVLETLNPLYKDVLLTNLHFTDFDIDFVPFYNFITQYDSLNTFANEQIAAIIVQQPNFFGYLEDVDEIAAFARKIGAMLIMVVNPISLGVLKSPGEYGADIVVGEGQPLGIPLNFGGPYLGFMAAKQKFVRDIPGRIVGETTDSDGNRGYVLTLQTREQHIRREKATSNICSNQALCALAASVYMAVMGKEGIRKIGELNIDRSHYLSEKLANIKKINVYNDTAFFNEFVIETDVEANKVLSALKKKGIIGGISLKQFYPDLKNHILVCVTETKSQEDIDRFLRELEFFLDNKKNETPHEIIV